MGRGGVPPDFLANAAACSEGRARRTRPGHPLQGARAEWTTARSRPAPRGDRLARRDRPTLETARHSAWHRRRRADLAAARRGAPRFRRARWQLVSGAFRPAWPAQHGPSRFSQPWLRPHRRDSPLRELSPYPRPRPRAARVRSPEEEAAFERVKESAQPPRRARLGLERGRSDGESTRCARSSPRSPRSRGRTGGYRGRPAMAGAGDRRGAAARPESSTRPFSLTRPGSRPRVGRLLSALLQLPLVLDAVAGVRQGVQAARTPSGRPGSVAAPEIPRIAVQPPQRLLRSGRGSGLPWLRRPRPSRAPSTRCPGRPCGRCSRTCRNRPSARSITWRPR